MSDCFFVEFARFSRKNEAKSKAKGRPIYEPVDYVKIRQPGDLYPWVGPATDAHRLQFKAEWQQYIAAIGAGP